MIREHFQDDQIIAEEENMEFIDPRAEDLIIRCFEKLNISEIEMALILCILSP